MGGIIAFVCLLGFASGGLIGLGTLAAALGYLVAAAALFLPLLVIGGDPRAPSSAPLIMAYLVGVMPFMACMAMGFLAGGGVARHSAARRGLDPAATDGAPEVPTADPRRTPLGEDGPTRLRGGIAVASLVSVGAVALGNLLGRA